MNGLYIVGGQQRALRSLKTGAQDWYKYHKAIILHACPENEQAKLCVSYVSPPDVCASEEPAILFKSGSINTDRLYVCTQTEVLVYQLPSFEQIGYLSLPHFNDLHHVRPTPDGTLLVVNTGLDMVFDVKLDGQIVREWNVLGEEPWSRFSPDIDYRRVASTKPHLAHPNYVFYIDDDIWVTRFEQKDAICLTQPGKRIDIGIERVHDGVVYRDHIYFTTVDAHVVVVNKHTYTIEDIVDLQELHEEKVLLGWCRSIFVDNDKVWVGFSRLRPTKFRDNVSWVKHGFRRILPTHVGCYNFATKQHILDMDVEQHGINTIFSLLPAVS